MRFIEQPNLPQTDARAVIIGGTYAEELNLARFRIEAICLQAEARFDLPVQSHADMQVMQLYRNEFAICDKIVCNAMKLYSNFPQEIRFLQGQTTPEKTYPACCAYNVLIFRGLAVYNRNAIDARVRERIQALGYRSIYINQGFARCSVCIVDENAVITADTGIAKALAAEGIDVLHIQPGFINLPGYDYGFIGGSSFKINKNQLAFTGNLDQHPDKDRIMNFLKARGVTPIFLTDKPIFDIGSAIPVLENE